MIDRMFSLVLYAASVLWTITYAAAVINGNDDRTDYLIIALLCWVVGRLMETTEGGHDA